MGEGGRHLKMTAKSATTKASAICFSADGELCDFPEVSPVDIVFNIQRDYYNGLVRPQLQIRDWRPHEE